MKQLLFIVLLLIAFSVGYSQQEAPQRVSFSAHVIFQAFKVPFASPETYAQNKGLGVAALYDLSRKAVLQQSMELGYYFNKYHGSTYMLSTSVSFNPIRSRLVKAGVSLGAGYMNSGFSDGGWKQNDHGEWTSTFNRKGNLFIPADVHVRVKVYVDDRIVLSPLLSYQVNALMNYSYAATILPQSIIKAGLHLTLY